MEKTISTFFNPHFKCLTEFLLASKLMVAYSKVIPDNFYRICQPKIWINSKYTRKEKIFFSIIKK
ncbi:MAG: hypothetical protein CL532_09885 [Aestuariivita sp.]|nr:hypothetical protein [Aestuariivita sp.]